MKSVAMLVVGKAVGHPPRAVMRFVLQDATSAGVATARVVKAADTYAISTAPTRVALFFRGPVAI